MGRIQFYGHFKQLTSNITKEKMRMCLRKGNLKREAESLRRAAQSNTIRNNHIKARIDKLQQNSNHIISKLAQKEYKTRHDWVGKVIDWKLCKKLKFNHMNKWDTYNQKSILDNETHKLLGDFKMHTDYLISARWPDLIIINKTKRTCRIVDFAVLADHRVKLKESEKKDKYLDLARELKKTEEHESDNYNNWN